MIKSDNHDLNEDYGESITRAKAYKVLFINDMGRDRYVVKTSVARENVRYTRKHGFYISRLERKVPESKLSCGIF